MLFSSLGCPCCAGSECIKTQDVAIIQTSNVFLDGRFIDNLVVRYNNKVTKKCDSRTVKIGSECHKAKFPVHIEVQLFLRETLRQSIEFDMPKNSILNFYNGVACEAIPDSIITSPVNYTHEGEFYRAVQEAVDNGMFIDSSRSEIACWVIKQLEEDNYFRCTKYQTEEQEHSCCEE